MQPRDTLDTAPYTTARQLARPRGRALQLEHREWSDGLVRGLRAVAGYLLPWCVGHVAGFGFRTCNYVD